MRRRKSLETGLKVVGTLILLIGTYLPWTQSNPAFPSNREYPSIYVPGLSSGFEFAGVVILCVAVATLAVDQLSASSRVRAGGSIVGALLVLIIAGGFILTSPLTGFGNVDNAFMVTRGWYLTVLGGLVFGVAGVFGYR